jgi:hypothetical protein
MEVRRLRKALARSAGANRNVGSRGKGHHCPFHVPSRVTRPARCGHRMRRFAIFRSRYSSSSCSPTLSGNESRVDQELYRFLTGALDQALAHVARVTGPPETKPCRARALQEVGPLDYRGRRPRLSSHEVTRESTPRVRGFVVHIGTHVGLEGPRERSCRFANQREGKGAPDGVWSASLS